MSPRRFWLELAALIAFAIAGFIMAVYAALMYDGSRAGW